MRTITLLGLAALTAFAQPAWENPVKKLLKEGKPVIGATITAASPEVAAQAAGMGFDFLWIEMEHSPITLERGLRRRRIEPDVTHGVQAEVCCERTRPQSRPFLHWCVCPNLSMVPGRRLNIGEAPAALP